jgi:hypothetical protein
VRGLLLVTIVGYPFMPSQYGFLNEVILLERLGTFRQFGRSRTLSRGFEGEFFVRWLVQIFLGLTFSLCFWMCAKTLGSTLIGNELTWYRPGLNDLDGLIFQTAVWISVAFFGVYRFFAYIDRRIRLEGWELDLRIKAVARRLEERAN